MSSCQTVVPPQLADLLLYGCNLQIDDTQLARGGLLLIMRLPTCPNRISTGSLETPARPHWQSSGKSMTLLPGHFHVSCRYTHQFNTGAS